MARGRSTHAKREREQQRLERNRAKAERRATREKEERNPRAEDGEDPDIAGIVPGPQPVREDW
jgi:hypothetical protein